MSLAKANNLVDARLYSFPSKLARLGEEILARVAMLDRLSQIDIMQLHQPPSSLD